MFRGNLNFYVVFKENKRPKSTCITIYPLHSVFFYPRSIFKKYSALTRARTIDVIETFVTVKIKYRTLLSDYLILFTLLTLMIHSYYF